MKSLFLILITLTFSSFIYADDSSDKEVKKRPLSRFQKARASQQARLEAEAKAKAEGKTLEEYNKDKEEEDLK